MSGLYSGSSIANTVTTETFTIPLMKRTGFSAEKAGAVEVAASTNGQLTPPVMRAVAFLMPELTGVSYAEIIKHALVPAPVSYIALVYIVHLEAMKMDLKGLPKPPSSMTFMSKLIGFLGGFIGIALLGLAVYYGLGWIKVAVPSISLPVVVVLCSTIYLFLIWCIIIEQLSPAYSAVWATFWSNIRSRLSSVTLVATALHSSEAKASGSRAWLLVHAT
jgi:TRAP-type uncharacterized transport system fused permease subunit